MSIGHDVLPAIFPVMDGRLRMTLRMLDRYDGLGKTEPKPWPKELSMQEAARKDFSEFNRDDHPSRQFIRDLFQTEDLMNVWLVERCDCGSSMRVGDYACWGRCYENCVRPALESTE